MGYSSGILWSMVAFFLGLLAQVTVGAEESLDSNEQTWILSTVAVIGGVVGLVIVVVICAGQTKVNPNVRRPGPPDWSKSLFYKQELGGGFTAVSDGMANISPFHVARERLGAAVTDAARWSTPMKDGKHVFEIYWPAKKNRGYCSCIGVGSEEVPLKKQGRVSLIGEHSQSWGLDLSKRRAIHFNQVQQRLYLGVPDRFFMYVDMDAGKIGFGGDVCTMGPETEFFGFILTGIPKGKSMYLMVSSCMPREQLHVHYRGTHTPFGGYDLVNSPSPLLSPQQPGMTVYTVWTANSGPPPPAPPKYDSGGDSTSVESAESQKKSTKQKF